MNALQIATMRGMRLTDASLLVLLALAVALAALPAADSAHARDTTIWSATLTVDEDDVYFGCDNTEDTQANCSRATVLTDDDFTYKGATHTIDSLYWESGNLPLLSLSIAGKDGNQVRPALTGLALYVNQTPFAIGDARVSGNLLSWDFDPDPDWTDGQKVSLSLVELAAPGNPHLLNLMAWPDHQQVTLTWDAAPDDEKARITKYQVQQGTSHSAMMASEWKDIAGSNSGTTNAHGHRPWEGRVLLLQRPGVRPGWRGSRFAAGERNDALARGHEPGHHLKPQERRNLPRGREDRGHRHLHRGGDRNRRSLPAARHRRHRPVRRLRQRERRRRSWSSHTPSSQRDKDADGVSIPKNPIIYGKLGPRCHHRR